MSNSDEEILKLVAAVLCGEELSIEEKRRLKKWLQAEPENHRKYDYYQRLFEQREFLKVWEQLGIQPTLPKTVCCERPKGGAFIQTILKYAAVLLPFTGILFWLLWQTPEQLSPPTVPVIVENDIDPGYPKARLVLENGETVTLSDSNRSIPSHQDIQVGKGGILQYAGNVKKQPRKAVYHTLVVDRGAEFQLVLPDGTKVWLNSDSELRYPDIFNEADRKVYLKGEAYFDVAHLAEQPFIVTASTCDIRVLGTEFNVSCYEGEAQVVTTLVKGKVAYRAGEDKGELQPGWQCVYDAGKKSTDIKKVNVAGYISWKNGLFVFDGVKMEDLAKQVERWYNVNVVFADNMVRNNRFTGAMERYKPVSYLISMLNETNTVECSLEGNLLVFRKK